jgi:hypothetical protein
LVFSWQWDFNTPSPFWGLILRMHFVAIDKNHFTKQKRWFLRILIFFPNRLMYREPILLIAIDRIKRTGFYRLFVWGFRFKWFQGLRQLLFFFEAVSRKDRGWQNAGCIRPRPHSWLVFVTNEPTKNTVNNDKHQQKRQLTGKPTVWSGPYLQNH